MSAPVRVTEVEVTEQGWRPTDHIGAIPLYRVTLTVEVRSAEGAGSVAKMLSDRVTGVDVKNLEALLAECREAADEMIRSATAQQTADIDTDTDTDPNRSTSL